MADMNRDTPRGRGDSDAPHLSPATPMEDVRTIMLNDISWGAVLAGALLALVAQLVINMLGIGIGAATLDPAAGAQANPSASSFSIGAGIWFVLSGILASLIGGYAAGRLSGKPKDSTAGWHGLTSWAVTTLMVFYLLSSAVGTLVGGTYRTLTDAMGGIGQTAVSVARQAGGPSTTGSTGFDPFASIEQSMRQNGNDPAALRDAAVAALRAAVTSDPAQAAEARERAAQAISNARGIPLDQARAQVQQYEAQYAQALNQTREQATQVADTAATAVSSGALLAALGLVLGAAAAWFGGYLGAVDPTLTGGRIAMAGGYSHAAAYERNARNDTTIRRSDYPAGGGTTTR